MNSEATLARRNTKDETMSAETFSGCSGLVSVTLDEDTIYLRAAMPDGQAPCLMPEEAHELGHWLISAAEELRLLAGE